MQNLLFRSTYLPRTRYRCLVDGNESFIDDTAYICTLITSYSALGNTDVAHQLSRVSLHISSAHSLKQQTFDHNISKIVVRAGNKTTFACIILCTVSSDAWRTWSLACMCGYGSCPVISS